MRVTIICLLATAVLGAQNRAASTGANPPQQQLPTDCAADGTVLNALTGQPLPRASVTPSANDGGTGTSTDPEGKWTIANLICGSQIFRAEKDGYIQNSYGRSASLPTGNGAPVKPAVLTSGSAAHNLKIELMPESVAIGRVLDDAGDPVGSAQVRVERSIVQNGKRTAQRFSGATTDSAGAYRVGGLPAGRYFFCATSSRLRYPVGGGSATAYAENCFPGPVTVGSGGGLQVEGGQEVHADFTLSRVTGVHVRGAITGMPQQTNANPDLTRVEMYRVDADGRIDFGGIPAQQARNRKFDFPNVTPGSYALRANFVSRGEVAVANAFVDVGRTDLEGVSLVFQPAAPVSGTVQIEDIAQPTCQSTTPQTAQQAGRAPDENPARPTVNVNLNPVGIGGNRGRIQWDSEQKSFVIPEVQAGKYRLNLNSTGPGYFVKSVRLHDHDVRNEEFTVEGPTGPIEIVISNDSGSLKGTVNDTDGNPAAGRIILLCGDYPAQLGRSQDDGTVNMRNIPAGPCRAWSFDESSEVEYADEDWMRLYAGSGTDVNITRGSDAQVSLVRRVVPQ
jgi:hypothetical protein